MGQAKAKKARLEGQLRERGFVAEAMKRVLGAVSVDFGVDCAAYANVGAIVLRELGYADAKAVAGESIWRVGPGDGDVVSHALSTMQPGMGFYGRKDAGPMSKMFHAWVECGSEIVDFTTYTLPQKAALLDEADGGVTLVEWAPQCLWVSKDRCLPLDAVSQSFKVGVYGYLREAAIEEEVLRWADDELSPESIAESVLMIYRMLIGGNRVEVLNFDESGVAVGVTARAREAMHKPFVNKRVDEC